MVIEQVLTFANRKDYQINNFKKFLGDIHFSYTIPSIHVAGTNGKGSTCIYLANSYISNDYNVGLFVSPSARSTNEMISINNSLISDDEINEIINPYIDKFKKFDLSIFEIQTFIALSYFQKRNVNLAIIECGMGGEYDATNIFIPILSIITSVSLEHCNFLGHSICEVARHKAGIIYDNVDVIIGSLDKEAESVIIESANSHKSKVFNIAEMANYSNNDCISFSYSFIRDIKLNTKSKYETINARIALEALIALNTKYPVNFELVKKSLQNVTISSRFEYVHFNPTVVCDGGHNPEAINNLVDCMEEVFGDKKVHVVFSSFKDKNIALMLPALSKISNDIHLTYFDNIRCRTDMDYFLFLDEYSYEQDHISLIKKLMVENPDDVILVTGSLAFAFLVSNEFKEGKYNE